MKGRAPNKSEKQFHDSMAQIGCIACRKDGMFNPVVSIHHIDGRTKPGAHKLALPLCYPHHQGDGKVVPSVHGNKRQFENRYGTQRQLLAECNELLRGQAT